MSAANAPPERTAKTEHASSVFFIECPNLVECRDRAVGSVVRIYHTIYVTSYFIAAHCGMPATLLAATRMDLRPMGRNWARTPSRRTGNRRLPAKAERTDPARCRRPEAPSAAHSRWSAHGVRPLLLGTASPSNKPAPLRGRQFLPPTPARRR